MDKPLWDLRVQAPVARAGSGPGLGRCFPVFPKVDTPYGQALTGLRVQAPLGARVLSFVCCAPNDGFSPQSGLVQRGILYAAAWGSENHTTALRALEMHPPLVAGATTFPLYEGALWMFSNGAMSLQESMEQFILSPGWGKVRRSRIRGSRAAANHQNANQAI